MSDDVEEGVYAEAVRLNEVATDARARAVLMKLYKRIGEDVTQAVNELRALGVVDDDINRLVEMELIIASKYQPEGKYEPERGEPEADVSS